MTNTPSQALVDVERLVEAAIEAWHEGRQPLHDWLGWSWDEFKAYVADPKAIPRPPKHYAMFSTPSLQTGGEGLDPATIEACARVLDERAAMRVRLHNENGHSINAYKACEAEDAAAAIRALTPSGVEGETVPPIPAGMVPSDV